MTDEILVVIDCFTRRLPKHMRYDTIRCYAACIDTDAPIGLHSGVLGYEHWKERSKSGVRLGLMKDRCQRQETMFITLGNVHSTTIVEWSYREYTVGYT